MRGASILDTTPERTIQTRRIYEGRIITVRIDTVALPQGRTAQREIVEHSDAVTVVPLDAQGNLVLVRQYRKAVEAMLLELPAGGVQTGETPEQAAHRELQEEAGIRAERLEKLGEFYTTPGFTTELMHLYLAQGLVAGIATPEEDESIEVVRMPLQEAVSLVLTGHIRDAKSIAGILSASLKLQKQRRR